MCSVETQISELYPDQDRIQLLEIRLVTIGSNKYSNRFEYVKLSRQKKIYKHFFVFFFLFRTVYCQM